ncbi:hypothetical protein GX586_12185 [bacterium]|nr:hypothetical protein [bacterium]
MKTLTPETLDALVKPAPRLPLLAGWLLSDVWSSDRFSRLAPADYLKEGESLVHHMEELLATAAWRVYDELASAAAATGLLTPRLDASTVMVVFDGLSLREVPLLLSLAAESHCRVAAPVRTSYAALPSDTLSFVEQRLIGKPVTPKLLPQRAELKDKSITAFYLNDVSSSQHIGACDHNGLLIWSAFPDVTYRDSSARFDRHFETMCSLLGIAWKNTVMQAPRGRRIIITSDHGYAYLGAGLAATRATAMCDALGQDRFKVFAANEPLPDPGIERDVQLIADRRLVMLRGRLKNRPQGHSANLLYRHGGMSLMEMLVPWIELEQQ